MGLILFPFFNMGGYWEIMENTHLKNLDVLKSIYAVICWVCNICEINCTLTLHLFIWIQSRDKNITANFVGLFYTVQEFSKKESNVKCMLLS